MKMQTNEYSVSVDHIYTQTGYRKSSSRINEDYFQADTEYRLFVVADGVGGEGNGNYASRIAICSLRERLYPFLMNAKEKDFYDSEDITNKIEEAVRFVSSEIINPISRTSMPLSNISTTLSLCYINGNRLYTANVGDSPIMLCRSDDVIELSRTDRTESDYLSQVVGNPSIEVHNNCIALQNKDRIILATDWLTDNHSHSQLQRIVSEGEFDKILDTLYYAANHKEDDVTAILLEVS